MGKKTTFMNLDYEDIFHENNPLKIQCYLETISKICRENHWYASSVYAASAAEALFHMSFLGDKAQKPVQYIHITDIHYSAYPEHTNDDDAI